MTRTLEPTLPSLTWASDTVSQPHANFAISRKNPKAAQSDRGPRESPRNSWDMRRTRWDAVTEPGHSPTHFRAIELGLVTQLNDIPSVIAEIRALADGRTDRAINPHTFV